MGEVQLLNFNTGEPVTYWDRARHLATGDYSVWLAGCIDYTNKVNNPSAKNILDEPPFLSFGWFWNHWKLLAAIAILFYILLNLSTIYSNLRRTKK
jgi:hypothetical protein